MKQPAANPFAGTMSGASGSRTAKPAAAKPKAAAAAPPKPAAPAGPTPEYCLSLTEATAEYLCPVEANTVGLDFLHFKVRDMDTKRVYFEVSQDPRFPQVGRAECDPSGRMIRYHFPREFLHSSNIGAALEFAVGQQPLENFRMIERHYFRGTLLKSYDFTFGFVIPGSKNSWEVIYDVPPLTPEMEQQMVSNPFETVSDSFYFVGDRLVMHAKAAYAYDA